MPATLTKIKAAQPMGMYTETDIDRRKIAADFRLMQVSPNFIRWRDGRGEIVSDRQLKKLQAAHPNWMTDF